LDIFDKKFKMAKEDAADIKAALKKFDGGEHEKLINSIKKAITIALSTSDTALHRQNPNCVSDICSQIFWQLINIYIFI
ncbi:MAG: hypothetical protein H7831_18200, partial [Magnetococcus sp. WYHC-3]